MESQDLLKTKKLFFTEVYKKTKDIKSEKKGSLDYASWAVVIAKARELDPFATYEYYYNNEGIPVFGNETVGYFVKVKATFDGESFTEQLPVLDHNNKPILKEVYVWEKKDKRTGKVYKIPVERLNSDNINYALKRCMVKAFAHFGIGLHHYLKDTGDILAPKKGLTDDEFKRLCALSIDQILSYRHSYELTALQEKEIDALIIEATKEKNFQKGKSIVEIAKQKAKE